MTANPPDAAETGDPAPPKPRRRVTPLRLAIAAVVAAGLAFRMFGPISTPPFRDASHRILPASIAEVERWRINRVDESVIIRGRDKSNPVLIWLHGGPGSSETPVLRAFNSPLEDHFTVVYWDQRLAGQTLDPLAPAPKRLTIADMLSDMDVVVDRVRARLGQDRVLLVGHSWGTMLGVIYTSRHPEKVAAYVGVGQMADKPKAETASYAYALHQAQARGDAKASAELKRIGPPPYRGEEIFTEREWLTKFGGETHADLSMLKLILIGMREPEANWRDLWATNHGGLLGYHLLEPQLLSTNLDHTYTHFEAPIFIGAGRYDHLTDASLSKAYFDRISAPQKRFVWFEQSGHNPHLEEASRFNSWMISVVRPVVVSRDRPLDGARASP
jgi:proline iminopeptidase